MMRDVFNDVFTLIVSLIVLWLNGILLGSNVFILRWISVSAFSLWL